MKFITTLFERKISTYLCISIAIVCRIVSFLYKEIFSTDKLWQFLQSKSFLNGNGLGIPQYFVSQLDHPTYDYTPRWPPGYPLLVSPFLKIFNNDIYWATGAIDVISCIAFIFVVRRICRQLSFPIAAVNIMTLIAGCFEYPFISRNFPTDTISLVWVLFAFSFLYKNVTSKHFSMGLQVLCGFFLFLPCAFRYAYSPVMLPIPIVFVIFGWFLKDKLLIRKGFTVFGVLAIFLTTMLILLYKFTGQISYVYPTEKGLFWSNLIYWYPIVPGSFIEFSFFITQAIKNLPLKLPALLLLIQLINVAGMFLFAYFIHIFFWKKSFSSLPNYKWGIVFGIVASLLICLTLSYMSLTNRSVNPSGRNWNYILEGRYFAILILFIQFFFTGCIFLSDAWKKRVWRKIILIICSVVMFIEISHSIYFHTKVIFNFRKYQHEYADRTNQYFGSLIDFLDKEYKGYDVLISSEDDFFPCMALYHNKKGIFDSENLNNSLPKVKTKSILIVIRWVDDKDAFKKFLLNKGVRKLNRVESSEFYMIELYP